MGVSVKQMVSDWQYLEDTYGPPYDFCGGFCQEDALRSLLYGEKTRREVLYDLLEYYFSKPTALEQLDLSDERVLKIAKRYNFEIKF